MKNKYFSVHVHLAPPVRENPWLGEPDPDASEAPFRDGLEAAFHDCWGPNGAAGRLGEDGRLSGSENNFARLAFSASPALLAWLERRHPRTYARLLEGDRRSVGELGHGNALATADPPLILPRASPSDRRVAVRWGLRDFERRFGRAAEGFWLPENAVDDATLETLAGEGVAFTLLAAGSAGGWSVRSRGSPSGTDWGRVESATLDAGLPYLWRSGSGRELAVLFHRDAEPPGRDPRRFAFRIADSFHPGDAVELRLLSADAGAFGRSRAYGERALAYAFEALPAETPVMRTNPAAFLALLRPPLEVRLGPPGPGEPSAAWKAPLAAAIQRLGRGLGERFAAEGRRVFRDPSAALEDYGALAPGPEAAEAFLRRHALAHPTPEQARAALRLLEAARWRLESLAGSVHLDGAGLRHTLAAAARAVELMPGGGELEPPFRAELAAVPSGPKRTLADIYQEVKLSSSVSLEQLCAHAAAAGHLGLGGPEPAGFELRAEALGRWEHGGAASPASASLWSVSARSRRTFEGRAAGAGVILRGATGLDLWLAPSAEAAASAAPALAAARDALELEAALRAAFGEPRWGLDALLPEARRRAARELRPFGAGAARALHARWVEVCRRLRSGRATDEETLGLLAQAASAGLEADSLPGAGELRERLLRSAEAFAAEPGEEAARGLDERLAAAASGGLHLALWEFQDLALEGLRTLGPEAGPAGRRLAERLGLSPAVFAEGSWSRASCS